MACASYLSRRDGRYYLQVRLSRTPARLLGKQLYRVSLRTSNYRQARIRLSEHLGWIHRMNDSVDYASLLQLDRMLPDIPNRKNVPMFKHKPEPKTCPYLFPEWEPYLKPDGEIRLGAAYHQELAAS
ncbi:hypothetical protein [Nitratireductor basaltis]|uniref:Uncharacterized protein n=1 Tax=Nitratireductor basaltis TaxID=472175 RepID=A0A084U8Y6_9HYPH|nr:hypothetical protein [Nitratireductor basaltis]KFB09422.1 hypothetical protein EL18_00437 [Nitratireductor basaltis]